MTDFQTLESLAREICDSRNKPGHYDKPRTRRNHWRRLADIEIARARGNTLEVLMSAFFKKRARE